MLGTPQVCAAGLESTSGGAILPCIGEFEKLNGYARHSLDLPGDFFKGLHGERFQEPQPGVGPSSRGPQLESNAW